MGTCLVTTLKDSVNDDSLLKLDEFSFLVDSTKVVSLDFSAYPNPNVEMTIVGDGYFTDSTGTSNLGKTKTAETNYHANTYYLSPGQYMVKLSQKQRIAEFNIGEGKEFNIESLMGFSSLRSATLRLSKINGDLLTFSYLPQIEKIFLYGTGTKDVTGDISSLSGKNLIHLNCSTPHIKGTMTDVANCMSVENASVIGLANLGNRLTGNINALANHTNLTLLYLSNTGVTGDTSSLANLTKLTTFDYANTAITGNWPLT